MAENTRSHKDVPSDGHEGKSRRDFMRAVLADLRALERMLQEGLSGRYLMSALGPGFTAAFQLIDAA